MDEDRMAVRGETEVSQQSLLSILRNELVPLSRDLTHILYSLQTHVLFSQVFCARK